MTAMLTCAWHPTYTAQRPPRADCDCCRHIYRARNMMDLTVVNKRNKKRRSPTSISSETQDLK